MNSRAKILKKILAFKPVLEAAGCALLAKDSNRILLIKRSSLVKNPNVWAFPGGKKDPKDSSFEETARRELLEETGIQINNITLVNTYYNHNFIYKTYLSILDKETIPTLNEENSDYLWVDFDQDLKKWLVPEPMLPSASIVVSKLEKLVKNII